MYKSFAEFKRSAVGRKCRIFQDVTVKPNGEILDLSLRHKFLNIPRKIKSINNTMLEFEFQGKTSGASINGAKSVVFTEKGFELHSQYEANGGQHNHILKYEFI